VEGKDVLKMNEPRSLLKTGDRSVREKLIPQVSRYSSPMRISII